MLKKRIKSIMIACVLFCTLPMTAYSMEKDDFLKMLVNSSYPEIKEEEKEQESKNTKDKNTDEKKEEKDFIKVHIGEENIPKIDNNKEKNKNEIATLNSSKYQNEVRVTKENPRILLYHSHAGETYSDSSEGNYHSKTHKDKSVLSVGNLITEELDKRGWGVVHNTTYNDYPEFNKSYQKSLETIQSMINKYKTIDIAVDLHRDGRTLIDTNTNKVIPEALNKEHERMTTTIDGEKVAKFFFVVGKRNPNYEQVKALADDITAFAQKKYPNLVGDVTVKPAGRFNQFVAKNHMLIEVGSNGTTSDEAKASAKYVAEILDEYFKNKK